jgi:acyl-[acyl-carrier-protein]-phospholipid O-acyltransferase/long-chain-fatty-acid--[acyl-carrier-protein] ligase
LTITLCTCLFLLFASAGGLFVVPLNTLIQTVTPKGLTARIVAGNNIVNAIGMVIISLTCVALAQRGLNIAALFLVVGLVRVLVTVDCCRLFPGELTRFFVRSLLRACFRVRVNGAEHLDNLPSRVIIIVNHVSLLDGLLVGACLPFRATFVMDKAWSEKWWVRPVRWFTDVLTVNAGSPRAVAAMIAGVKAGRRIVIFPEGCITTTGELSPIQPGAAFVAGRSDAAFLPIRIDGAIRSRLSYMKGKIPLRLFPKVSLTVSPCQTLPAPENADPAQLRDIQSQHLNDIMHRFCKTSVHA